MFFLLPVSVDHRATRRPLVTLGILGLCTLLYLISLMLWISGGEERLNSFLGALAFFPADARSYTWISNLFVHAGLLHYLGNMVYLYLFGACVEDLLGPWRFIVFYLLAGVVATLAHVVFSARGFNSEIPLLGASGAISGCMGACALWLRGMKVEFRFGYFFLVAAGMKTFYVPSWLMMTLWFADDLLGLLMSVGHEGGGTAFGAHVGGFLFGLGVAYALRRRVEQGDFAPADEPEEPATLAANQPSPVFVYFNETQQGPYPVHDVWHRVRTGAIPPEALYWREDLQQWRPVNEL